MFYHSTMPRKSIGSFCCIVGCPCTAGRCRGLSFHRLPRKGGKSEQDAWRRALLHSISRIDSSFNPEKAQICSRHFTDECFSYGPSGKRRKLILGSLPTRWMPSKSIETPKTTRSEPSYRAPPVEPKRVCYYNFEEIQKDIDKVQAPWCVTQNTSSCIQLAVISQNYVKLGVSLHSETDMQAFVTVYGMKAAYLTTNLESKKLVKFLRELQEMTACAGVTATHLQDYASLPDGTKKYFRHVLYHFSDGPCCHTSCVRSASCSLLLATSDSPTAVCKDCRQVERMLSARHHGRSSRALGTIKTNDPLFGVPMPQLKEAFKKARYSQRQAEKQLEALKEKLKHLQPQGGDQVRNSFEATDTPSVETQKNLKATDTPPLETQNSVKSSDTPSAEMQNNLKATDTPSVEMQALNTPSVEFLQMKAFCIASVEINSSDIPSVEMHSDIKPFDTTSVKMHSDLKPFDTPSVEMLSEIKPYDTPSLEIHSDIKPFDTLSVEIHRDIKPFDTPAVAIHNDIKTFDTTSLEIHGDSKVFDTPSVEIKPFDTQSMEMHSDIKLFDTSVEMHNSFKAVGTRSVKDVKTDIKLEYEEVCQCQRPSV